MNRLLSIFRAMLHSSESAITPVPSPTLPTPPMPRQRTLEDEERDIETVMGKARSDLRVINRIAAAANLPQVGVFRDDD